MWLAGGWTEGCKWNSRAGATLWRVNQEWAKGADRQTSKQPAEQRISSPINRRRRFDLSRTDWGSTARKVGKHGNRTSMCHPRGTTRNHRPRGPEDWRAGTLGTLQQHMTAYRSLCSRAAQEGDTRVREEYRGTVDTEYVLNSEVRRPEEPLKDTILLTPYSLQILSSGNEPHHPVPLG